MRTVLETITPARAADLLARNPVNRKVRTAHVHALARTIIQGRWKTTHQGIAINPDGTLQDGQHRLSAIVLAGVPVTMNVTYDADPDAFDALDGGLKRGAADVLGMHGVLDGNHVAAVARLHHQIIHTPHARTALSARALDNTQIIRYVDEHPAIVVGSKFGRRAAHTRINASSLGAAYALIAETTNSPAHLHEFGERLLDGAALLPGDPRLTLREAGLRTVGQGRRVRGPVEWAAFVVKAWNAYRQGRDLTILRFSDTEAFPTVAP